MAQEKINYIDFEFLDVEGDRVLSGLTEIHFYLYRGCYLSYRDLLYIPHFKVNLILDHPLLASFPSNKYL